MCKKEFDITIAKIYSVKIKAKTKKEAEDIVMKGDERNWVFLDAELYRIRKTKAMILREMRDKIGKGDFR